MQRDQKPALTLALLAAIGVACVSVTATQGIKLADRIARVEAGLLPAVVLKGQTTPATIAARMKQLAVPGVSVAVINDGAIEWAKGYGVIEAGGSAPVTPDTLFQAASISKPVAVMGMLALVEQGRLTLDEDVNRTLKSWKVPENEFTKQEKVTLRRLASHSAGLTVHGFRGYAATEPVPTIVQVLDGQKPANSAPVRVDLAPGSRWRYSGGGITAMQLLMTDATGQPFPALMRALVLDKIGMTNSSYEQPVPAARAARAAVGHRRTGDPISGKWHTYPEMAAAGLWTTPTDLAAFAIEVQRSYAGKSNKVLSQAMVTQMLTRQSGAYGLGLGLGGAGQAATFSHGGSNEGFKCTLFAYVSAGQGAVIMTNGDQGAAVATEILRSISREYGWPDYRPAEITPIKVSAELFKAYVGEYDVNGRVVITTENGKLYIQPPGEPRMELLPVSETEFALAAQNLRIVFVRDAQGAVNELTVRAPGGNATGKRIK